MTFVQRHPGAFISVRTAFISYNRGNLEEKILRIWPSLDINDLVWANKKEDQYLTAILLTKLNSYIQKKVQGLVKTALL